VNWITPYRLTAEDRPHARALHEALVRDLMEKSRIPVVILLGSMGLFFSLLKDVANSSLWLRFLFPAMVLVTLARAVLVVQWNPERRGRRRLFSTFTVFFAGAILSGLLLGGVVLAAAPYLDAGRFLLVCLCLSGISSIAVVSMAGSPSCYAAMVVPSVGAVALTGALHPPFGLGYLFTPVILLGLAGYLVMSIQVHLALCRNVLLSQRLGDLALRDQLTGLRNRRYLLEFMQEETPRVLRRWLNPAVEVRSLRSISLILLDLDFFKRVNDDYGHAAGDAVLLQVAQVLKEVVRKPDLVIRWGGEEFLIVALDSDRAAPPLIALRVHEALAQHRFILPGGQELRQTCSLGFGLYPFLSERPEALEWEQVFRIADEGLYLAKARGRNRVHGLVATAAAADEVVAALAGADPDFPAAVEQGLVQII
jgi:diguanylate cyclase (GGDEF)-like protein